MIVLRDQMNGMPIEESEFKASAGIAEFMEKPYEELKRRRQVQSQNSFEQQDDHRSFPRAQCDGETPASFNDPEQQFIVYSLANTAIPPISPEPAIRLCGVFASEIEALHHAQQLAKRDTDCSVLFSTLKTWCVMASSFEMLADQNACNAIIENTLDNHHKSIKATEAEFNERLRPESTIESPVDSSENKHVKKDCLTQVQLSNDTCTNVDKESTIRQCFADYPRDMEIRNQNVAVISFLPGQTGKHPIFNVWACFNDSKEADTWIRNVAGDNIQDFDLDTVDLYEWLFPLAATDDKIKRVTYRNEEKQKILDFAKNQTKTVESFKEFCASNSQNLPVIEI